MKNLYTLILILVISTLSNAQIQVHVGDKINGSIAVTAVDETETFFWVGTNKGLYKIKKEGKDYVYYSTSNSDLQSNHITAICCRKDGDVWIGTTKGILYYDNYAFNTMDTDNSKLPENYITSMEEDSKGDLWIGTYSSGLVKVHRNKFQIFNHENSTLAGNNVHSILLDQQNNLTISLVKSEAVPLSSIVKK
jgi:ligand-binding sensor domain-containing protein